MNGDREWFAPKSYGYGAGIPISWQGWAVLAAFLALIAAACLLIPYTVIGFISVAMIITVPFVMIVARTTRGSWRWRWGGED